MARSRVRESDAEIARQIEAAIKEQDRAELVAAVDARAEEMKTYAESISPVSTSSDHPGRYRESFEVTKKDDQDGLPSRTLRNNDLVANLVEYGSVNNEEYAVLARTAETFGGSHHQGEE